jgi:hypothetical protein
MGDIGERATCPATSLRATAHSRSVAAAYRRPIVAKRDVNPKGKMIWDYRRVEMTAVLGSHRRRVSEIKAEYRAMRHLAG